jgi:hypothetical protein
MNPIDFNSLISAAYNAYQLLKPFKHYLEAAASVDPGRLLNFLNEFWLESRFKPQDSFQRLNVPQEEAVQRENDAKVMSGLLIDPERELSQAIKSLDDELFEHLQEGVMGAIATLQSGIDDDESTGDGGDGEDNDVINQWFDDILPKWQKSQLYKELPKISWKTRDGIPWMAARLYHDAHGELPLGWTWSKLEPVLIGDFPEHVSAPKYYFKSVGTVMQGFCSFLQSSQNMQNLTGISEKIKKISPKIYEHATEIGTWNQAKKYSF